MKISFARAALAAGLLVGAAAAHADTVTLTDYTYAPATAVTVGAPSYSGGAGQFSGFLNGASFTTYCTELTQDLFFGETYTDYSVVDGVTAWGAAKATMLGQLLTAVAQQSYVSNADKSAVIQAAIWEIIYESSGSYGFGSGTFTATSTAPLGDINWAGFAGAPSLYKVDQLHSEGHQDLLVITAVPEPSTYALMLAGLAGIGFVARRRTQQR